MVFPTAFKLFLLVTVLHIAESQYCSFKVAENKDGYLECDESSENVTGIFVPGGDPIKEIKKGLFDPFVKITNLHIVGAGIEKIEPGAFDALPLKVLQLNNNNIKRIQNGTCNSLANVTVLEITFNQIESLEADTFLGMVLLASLSLSANKIKYINRKAFNGLGNLQNLFISQNKLRELDINTFNPLTSLILLELAGNNFHNFELGIFSHQKNLETLTLSHNHLEGLPDNLFYNLTALSHLGLTFNNIKMLQSDLFNGIKNLKTLQFRFNNVSHFDTKNILPRLPQLKEIILVNNPWKCDELRKLKVSSVERGVSIPIFVHVVDKLNVDGISCEK